MINKYFKNYTEEIYNKEENYSKIIKKVKGEEKMKLTMKKILITVSTVIIVIFSGIQANTIYAKIKWNIDFKEFSTIDIVKQTTSLDEASTNGYGEILENEYLQADGVSLKIDSILITDDTFEAKVTFKFNEEIEVNTDTFNYGFIVYDEDKNVYAISERQTFSGEDSKIDFVYEELGISYDKNNIFNTALNDNMSTSNIDVDAQARTLQSQIVITANDAFPESKKIYIRIFDIGYTMVDIQKNDEEFDIATIEDFELSLAKREFEIILPEKFYERETIELKLETPIPVIEIEQLSVTETGLTLIFKSEDYYNGIMATKDVNNSLEEIKNMLSITNTTNEQFNILNQFSTANDFEVKILYDICKEDLENDLFLNININGQSYTSKLLK